MRCQERITNDANLIRHDKAKMTMVFFLSIGLVWLLTGSTTILYGQGSLVETVGTMEIGQEVDSAADRATPARVLDTSKPANEANNVTEQPSRAPGQMRGRPTPAQIAPPDTQQQEEAPAVLETPTAAPAMTETDTNVPDINDFNEFKRELDRIDLEARGEDTQWLGKQEKKAELAKAMDDVVVAELRFLRKVALAENDTNTVEAIDLVLKKRQDRLNKLVTKLETEVKEERRQQATERPKRTPRATGTQQQEPTQPRSTNPVKRSRDTLNQNQ